MSKNLFHPAMIVLYRCKVVHEVHLSTGSWDEWVGADRLMKCTEANLEKQKKLFKNQSGDKILRGRMPQSKPKGTAGNLQCCYEGFGLKHL